MVAATASVLFLGMFLAGVRALTAWADWGLAASAAQVWMYLSGAAAGTGVLVIGRFVVGSGTPDLPVANMDARVGAVLSTALLAGVPIVVLIWLAYAACYSPREQIETLPALPLRPDPSPTDPAYRPQPLPHRDVISRLLRMWDLLGFCIGSFALAVVAALASVINLPLVAAWRRSARSTVDQAYPLPPDGQPSEEWLAARSRLEALMHLDVSLLRNPLTALTVLSPLLSAAFAAFIPQIGNS
jgi:hypothetical protein